MFGAQRRFFNPTIPVDEQMFYELVRDKESNALIDGYRQSGDAELKRKLPAFIFQATFDETPSKKGKLGAWRKQAATRLTGLVVLDIDHVEKPIELINGKWRMENGKLVARDEWVANHHYPLSTIHSALERILLVYVTPSGKGLKIVFKANMAWGNLADNQIEMAKLLGVEADESGKDASRMAFVCKEEDIQFIDQELFTYENKEFAEKYNDQYRNGNSNPTHPAPVAHQEVRQVPAENRALAAEPLSLIPLSQQADNSPNKLGEQLLQAPPLTRGGAQGAEGSNAPLNFKGKPYSEIIDEWWNRHGGTPSPGERNVKLYNLAVNLRAICDNNKDLLLQIMPRLGLSDQEFQSIIDSACKEQPKGISKVMREILAEKAPAEEKYDLDINRKLWLWGKEFEELSQYFPILKDVTKGLKPNQFTAAFFVAGALMMTLMTRCWYRFYHRPEEKRRLNASVVIEGDPASGKSFATRLYKILMTPIFAADKVGKDAINAYRELMKTKGANKEKPTKPKVIVRNHPARTSNAQFIQDMVNSVEVVDGEEMQLHMITFDTELDNTLNIQKGGSWIDKLSLELKAFHNEEDGQAYSNVDSVLQDFIVTWNYIYTGTPMALKKKVNERNFGSGLATRLTCIPLPSTNFEMLTREDHVDYESDERLREWAAKLDRMKGELPMQKIVDALFDWTERRMADAAYNESKADEMLLKRCAYHGVNFAAPFIVMRHWNGLKKDGEFWCGEFETDDIDWRLVELIVNIQYACQKHYFGAMAEKYFDDKTRDAAVSRQRQQKTVESFGRLPEEFTVEEVMRCFNLASEASARAKISRLIADKLAKKGENFNEKGKAKALYYKVYSYIS